MLQPSPNHPLPWRKANALGTWFVIAANGRTVCRIAETGNDELTCDFIVTSAAMMDDAVPEVETRKTGTD
jgi:hypothetical protein